jgi:hypothetical protein
MLLKAKDGKDRTIRYKELASDRTIARMLVAYHVAIEL